MRDALEFFFRVFGMTQLGMEPSVFGMHSLWAGGATAAVRAGVAHHLFKRHGL